MNTNIPVPADCLRSFDTARKAPHTQSHDIFIAARILNPVMHGYDRTWKVLENAGIVRTQAKDLYIRTSHYLNSVTKNLPQKESYASLTQDLAAFFKDAHEVLQIRWDSYKDLPEPDYFSVQTGHHFMQSLSANAQSQNGNVIRLNKINPFLMVHVAAEFLHDLDSEISSRHDRELMWDKTTDLFSSMHSYCHELHNLVPFGLEPKDATADQFEWTSSSLQYLYGMLILSEESNLYTYIPDFKRDLKIIQAYVEPFGLASKASPKKEHDAKTLDWEKWGDIARDARARRDERRAAMPPSVFCDWLPFTR